MYAWHLLISSAPSQWLFIDNLKTPISSDLVIIRHELLKTNPTKMNDNMVLCDEEVT